MSVNINLVDNKNSEAIRREKTKKLRAISFSVLFVTAFLAVIIFAIDYRFSASYVQKQEAELLQELQPFSDVSAKLFITNTKLSDLNQILNKRLNHSKKVRLISDGARDVTIEEFTINSEGTQLKINSYSLSSIDEYLNYLVGLVDEEEFSGILLNSLQSNESGYVAELSLI